MLLVAFALIAAQPAAPQVWRCHREVYDLALYRGEVVAATSGGALVERAGRWVSLGQGAPAPLRRLVLSGPDLEAADRTGSVLALRDGRWVSTGAVLTGEAAGLPSPSVEYQGRRLVSPWGGASLLDEGGQAVLARDPAEGDYALLADGERLLAGTPSGLFAYSSGAWKAVPLPSDLPVTRPQGAAFGGGTVVGGLGGLYLRRGEDWSVISREPVRQVLESAGEVWVLYGSGSVDKLDPRKGQIGADVLYGSVGRPWASCLALVSGGVLCGGQGGWFEVSKAGKTEKYLPELGTDVVTAAAGRGSVRFIGTQASGLLRYGQGALKCWNPGNGLPDSWVTALLLTPEGLWVATAGQGLFLVNGDAIRAVPSPTQRPRQLALWNGRVVVGGMDGAWIREGSEWRPLPTQGEETTALVAGTRLVVCTAAGVWFVSDPATSGSSGRRRG